MTLIYGEDRKKVSCIKLNQTDEYKNMQKFRDK